MWMRAANGECHVVSEGGEERTVLCSTSVARSR
jgi:hypothetical protein